MLNTLYMTLTASPTGAVDIACSEPSLALPPPGAVVAVPGSGFAKASVHTMAWDVLAFAALKGCRVGGNVAANRVNPVLLIALAQALLDPEQLGLAVTAEVRDMARLALGKPAAESYMCPEWRRKHAVVETVTVTGKAEAATDWSAA